MGQFDLEKYFRDRIKGQTENVDTDAIWKALDLEQDDKNRGLIFWLKGIIPLALIGLSIWWFTLPNKSVEVADKSDVTKVEESITIQSTESEKTPIQPSQVSSDNSNSDISTESNISKNISTEKIQSNPSSQDLNNKKAKTPLINIQSTLTSFAAERNIYNLLPINSNDKRSTVLTNNSATLRKKEILPYLTVINKFNLSPFDISPRKVELGDFILPEIIEVNTNKNYLSFGIYSEYLLVNRSLTSTSSDISNLIDFRNGTEDILEAYTVGADIKYAFPSGIYLKAGLEYQNINERFTYNSIIQDTTITDNAPQTRFVSASGDTTVVTGPGLAYQSVNTEWVYYNKHVLLNLPLTLGYEIKRGKWSMFAEGSCSMSLLNSFSGHQFDKQLNVVDSPSYFSSSPIISVGGTIGIGYELSSRLRINISPRYQTYLNSFTTKESEMSQSYNLYGIRLGANYSLLGT